MAKIAGIVSQNPWWKHGVISGSDNGNTVFSVRREGTLMNSITFGMEG
jgi:hypothetical protein